jgi:hypothetical protein
MTEQYDIFVSALKTHLGLDVSELDERAEYLVGAARGQVAGDAELHFKATFKVCTFLIPVARLEPHEVNDGCNLFYNLLLLNFEHPYGRVGIVQLPADPEDKEFSEARVIVCETMFFWQEAVKNSVWFKEKATLRLKSLRDLFDAANEQVRQFRKRPDSDPPQSP